MDQQAYGITFGASPAENYQRFFVPAIGAPVADDLIEAADLRPALQAATRRSPKRPRRKESRKWKTEAIAARGFSPLPQPASPGLIAARGEFECGASSWRGREGGDQARLNPKPTFDSRNDGRVAGLVRESAKGAASQATRNVECGERPSLRIAACLW